MTKHVRDRERKQKMEDQIITSLAHTLIYILGSSLRHCQPI